MMKLLMLLSCVVMGAAGVRRFNMCCSIKAFNVESCMIKDGRVLENFSSKDKIAGFPITNGEINILSTMIFLRLVT